MQDIQRAIPGSYWSNRDAGNKRFKNISSLKPIRFTAWQLFKYFANRVWERAPRQPLGGYEKFGETWRRQCDVAKTREELLQDPAMASMDHVFWIGHASTLVCLFNGINILFDPIFSHRCSPIRCVGPKRRFPPGTTVEQLPKIDIVAISHNHYDHLDEGSIKAIYKRNSDAIFVVPLRMDTLLVPWGIPRSSIRTMNWQDEIWVKGVAIGCTPAQHYGRRGLFDMNQVLWCGWCIGWSPKPEADQSTPADSSSFRENDAGEQHSFGVATPFTLPINWSKLKVYYFAGDTAFNKDVFEVIRAHYDHIDLAALPIGAYEPRWFMSYQHVDPAQSVAIFKMLNIKKALGVHWATFELADESLDDPPRALVAALDAEGIKRDDFALIAMGEYLSF